MKNLLTNLRSFIIVSILISMSLVSCTDSNSPLSTENSKLNSDLMESISVPSNYYFTTDHVWIDIDELNATAVVGLTDYAVVDLGGAQKITKEISCESLIGCPKPKKTKTHTIKGVNKDKDMLAPLSGDYDEDNDDVLVDPSMVNSDPYGQGWIYTMTNVSVADRIYLMTAAEYIAYLNTL